MNRLPSDLPVPLDDGACDHLQGIAIPSISLPSTKGGVVDLAAAASLSSLDEASRMIVYIYPMTGHPSKELPAGWNDIPGARGCTPQSCSLRDHYQEIRALGAEVFGLSVQATEYQQEMAARLHLPFAVLSDSEFRFANALRLPTFLVDGKRLIKRLTLVLHRGKVEKVFYPVFPPDRHGEQLRDWLKLNKLGTRRSDG